jgi:hypothetical protein
MTPEPPADGKPSTQRHWDLYFCRRMTAAGQLELHHPEISLDDLSPAEREW